MQIKEFFEQQIEGSKSSMIDAYECMQQAIDDYCDQLIRTIVQRHRQGLSIPTHAQLCQALQQKVAMLSD